MGLKYSYALHLFMNVFHFYQNLHHIFFLFCWNLIGNQNIFRGLTRYQPLYCYMLLHMRYLKNKLFQGRDGRAGARGETGPQVSNFIEGV